MRTFGARLDKSLYALKGGCNLRFYFRSVRYSEDMALDIHTISVPTLRNNVERALQANAFRQSLRTHGIEVSDVLAPKLTQTRQRWKIALEATGLGLTLPTKIEFSRRGLEADLRVEAVDAEMIRAYRLYPVFVQHYSVHAAFARKVMALALREQIQSRDIFDLKLLLDAGGGDEPLPSSVTALLTPAIEHALAVSHDAFVAQVVSYLDPEYQIAYGTAHAWAELQGAVIDALEARVHEPD